MKKIILSVFVVSLLLMLIFTLAGCEHEHEWSEWSTSKNPTCIDSGMQERFCDCGEKQTKTLAALGHTEGEWIVDSDATCTEDGSKHQVCSVCSATITTEAIAALGHTEGEWIVDSDATCTEDGSKHQVCSVCSATITTEAIAALGHTEGEWIVDSDATCTEDGSKHKVCVVCDMTTQTEILSSFGHTFGKWMTLYAPSCTEGGLNSRTCDVCAYVETESIDANGHNLSNATCTSPKTCQNGCGYTEGEALGHIDSNGYCTRCGKKITIDMKTVVGHPDECKTTSFFGFCFYKNSADGIKVCWGGENLSGKTINYYTVTIYFYNSVGDPAYSEITGKSSKTIEYVGPVAPNKDMIIFSVVDYVPTCSKICIGEITLKYSDGTTDTGWYGWSTTKRNSSIR